MRLAGAVGTTLYSVYEFILAASTGAMMSHRIEIEFSAPGLSSHAMDLAAEVLEQWAHELSAITLVPTRTDGMLHVVVDGERIFSSAGDARPERGEINSAIEARLGPPPGGGA